jgi:CHASE3 domain sensor protein
MKKYGKMTLVFCIVLIVVVTFGTISFSQQKKRNDTSDGYDGEYDGFHEQHDGTV